MKNFVRTLGSKVEKSFEQARRILEWETWMPSMTLAKPFAL